MKLLCTVHYKNVATPGDVIDVEDIDEAAAMIDKGWAIRIEEPAPAPIEAAAFEAAPETATGRRQRKTPT